MSELDPIIITILVRNIVCSVIWLQRKGCWLYNTTKETHNCFVSDIKLKLFNPFVRNWVKAYGWESMFNISLTSKTYPLKCMKLSQHILKLHTRSMVVDPVTPHMLYVTADGTLIDYPVIAALRSGMHAAWHLLQCVIMARVGPYHRSTGNAAWPQLVVFFL